MKLFEIQTRAIERNIFTTVGQRTGTEGTESAAAKSKKITL